MTAIFACEMIRWVRMKGPDRPRLILLVPLVLIVAACSNPTQTREGPAAAVHELTGTHTRLVWVQHDGEDPFAAGDDLVLMGFDTEDDRGERVIRRERGSYVKPLLTPRGDRFVVSSRPNAPGGPQVSLGDWEGSSFEELASGFALTVWPDPRDGTEWVYVGSGHTEARPYDFATVTRFPIDDPARREVVWNDKASKATSFNLSTDGRMAGGEFPWPNIGLAELPNGPFQKLGEGCWPDFANVGSGLLWYFDGAHRNLTMVDVGTDKRWTVNINSAPGFRNPEVYHPRWTNHPRFLTMTGPYNRGGPNQVRSGGKQSEVYVGRFSADFSKVEAWVRLTHNDGGDSYPDVWMDRSDSPHAVPSSGALGPAGAAGDPSGAEERGPGAGRVVVEARLVSPGTIPTPQAIAPYRNALVVNGYEIIKVLEGDYDARQIQVAQWAIRDVQVLPTARKEPGSVHRLTLEPYDAHPELEGERLIDDSESTDLTLYYDTGEN
ncbi:MAG: hypothetical protein GEV06_13305 [Luteitalea sp.]|nr:hypothetical protein [Luteitalea sp.]